MIEATRQKVLRAVFAHALLPTPRELSGGVFYPCTPDVLGHECVCAIGVFDGLHEGHKVLIAEARADAQRREVPLVAVTFDPDPAEVVCSRSPRRLLQDETRIRALTTCSVDAILVHAFTPEFAGFSVREYVEKALLPYIHPVAIHVGSDFGFGARGEGRACDLAALGLRHGFEVIAHQLIEKDGSAISSTRIRNLIEAARIDEAAALLGRPHFLSGTVMHGRGQGASFGFPTANISLSPKDCMPADGVYACYIVDTQKPGGEEIWPAAVNVGVPRSFEVKKTPLLEANLLGFKGNLYGHTLNCVFMNYLRPPIVFQSVEELSTTVLKNIEWVRTHLDSVAQEASCDN